MPVRGNAVSGKSHSTDQTLQNLDQSSDVFWVGGRVYQEVVDVHNYIGESVDDSFYQALKTGWASQQAHWTGDPLKLAHSRHSEGCVWAGPGMQNHLPETGSEVDGTEDSTARFCQYTHSRPSLSTCPCRTDCLRHESLALILPLHPFSSLRIWGCCICCGLAE
jgi:hypothetical protein